MIENTEMRIFGQISDLHQARIVREEREIEETKQRDEREIKNKGKGRKPEYIMPLLQQSNFHLKQTNGHNRGGWKSGGWDGRTFYSNLCLDMCSDVCSDGRMFI